MKVLMCHKFYFDHGGAERYLFDLCDSLRSSGCEIANFSIADTRSRMNTYSQYAVAGRDYDKVLRGDWINKIKAAGSLIYSSEAKIKVERLVHDFKPQVAHLHNIYHHISPSILSVFRKNNIPVVMTLHDYHMICPNYKLFTKGRICTACKGRNYYHCLINKCIKDSWSASALGAFAAYIHSWLRMYDVIDVFIAPSRFMRDKVVECGIPEDKVVLLNYSVNLAGFCAGSGDGKYILYVGKLTEEKGLMSLIRSMKTLKALNLKIVGDGPLFPVLQQLVEDNNLVNVDLMGRKSQEEVQSLMREALCLVVPSLWSEPVGLVVYEAFASGKCVVAARSGGLPEWVQDGRNGYLFDPGDENGLVNAIKRVFANRQESLSMGKISFEKIAVLNNVAEHTANIKLLYQSLIHKRQG